MSTHVRSSISNTIVLLAKIITAVFIALSKYLGDRHFSVIRNKQQEIKPMCLLVFDSWQHIVAGDFSGSLYKFCRSF